MMPPVFTTGKKDYSQLLRLCQVHSVVSCCRKQQILKESVSEKVRECLCIISAPVRMKEKRETTETLSLSHSNQIIYIVPVTIRQFDI